MDAVSEIDDARHASEEPRAREAWRTWLSALARDADAAAAAAVTYGELEPEARDAWLEVVMHDASTLDVPRVALFAPLLLAETDPARRARLVDAMGETAPKPPTPDSVCALHGVA